MAGFTIASVIRKNALSRGDGSRRAVVLEGTSLTYDALDESTDRLAAGMSAAGVGKGDRVAVFAHNRIEFVELFFALAKLGAILVPVNYLYRAAEVSFVVEDSGATWLVVDPGRLDVARKVLDHHPGLQLVVCGSAELSGVSERSFDTLRDDAAFTPNEVIADDVFLLQYTSGTTGRPKAAVHTHATVMNNALSQLVDMDIRADDVYLNLPALCWAAGFHSLTFATWWRGGTVVLHPSGSLDLDEVGEAIARERVTTVILVPAVLRSALESGVLERHDVSSVRMVVAGGEPCPVPLLERLQQVAPNIDLLQAYGMSEFPTVMCILDPQFARSKVGSTGKPTSLTELRVVGPDGQSLPPGEDGEIIARSLATMREYWNNPGETGKSIVDQWLRTGDRGWVDEDGFLFISGRTKQMIISGGLNVYPAEIERELGTHPAIEEVAVVGMPDERLGEVGCAHVFLRRGAQVEERELVAFCRERLAGFKVPRAWVFHESPLPRTASNKLARSELQNPDNVRN